VIESYNLHQNLQKKHIYICFKRTFPFNWLEKYKQKPKLRSFWCPTLYALLKWLCINYRYFNL